MSGDGKAIAPHVMHLDDGRLWRGGQHQVWLLMVGLREVGVEQVLVAREGSPLARRAGEAGIRVEAIRYGGEWDWFAVKRVLQLTRLHGINILHAHTGHAHALGVAVARRAGQAFHMLSTRRVDFAIKNNFFSRRKYLWPGQHYIAISRGVQRVLEAGGVASDRISIVHSGVPPLKSPEGFSREAVLRELEIDPSRFVIANVGALVDHKDQMTLINAAPKILEALPEAEIHLFGEGELRSQLEARLAELGVGSRVRLHGFVDGIRAHLPAFDLFVSSSHLEGLGTSIIDAIMAGLPVVATAAGGVPEIVIDGQTGRLVPPRAPERLAEAVIHVCNQTEETARMKQAALVHVEAHFSARAMVEGVRGVYRELLADDAS